MADEFSAQLNATLSQYDNEIREGVRKSVDKNTETLEKELKRDSPRRRGTKRKRGGKFSPGSYARGWRTSTAVNNFSTYEKVVHNSTHYPLTHLLEKVTQSAAAVVWLPEFTSRLPKKERRKTLRKILNSL